MTSPLGVLQQRLGMQPPLDLLQWRLDACSPLGILEQRLSEGEGDTPRSAKYSGKKGTAKAERAAEIHMALKKVTPEQKAAGQESRALRDATQKTPARQRKAPATPPSTSSPVPDTRSAASSPTPEQIAKATKGLQGKARVAAVANLTPPPSHTSLDPQAQRQAIAKGKRVAKSAAKVRERQGGSKVVSDTTSIETRTSAQKKLDKATKAARKAHVESLITPDPTTGRRRMVTGVPPEGTAARGEWVKRQTERPVTTYTGRAGEGKLKEGEIPDTAYRRTRSVLRFKGEQPKTSTTKRDPETVRAEMLARHGLSLDRVRGTTPQTPPKAADSAVRESATEESTPKKKERKPGSSFPDLLRLNPLRLDPNKPPKPIEEMDVDEADDWLWLQKRSADVKRAKTQARKPQS